LQNNYSNKIGCIPNASDFLHPQDRRRYIPYFKAKNISFEPADYNKDYNILLISLNADLNKWANYKKKQIDKGKNVRIIFDLSDLYLVERVIIDCLRSIYHYLSGRTSTLRFTYKKTIMDMLQCSDVIICGSKEQKEYLSKKHDNVVIVRDYFFDDIRQIKNDYSLASKNELNILWEGLSHGNIEIFKMIRLILENLKEYNIRMHFITDLEYCKIGSSYLCQPTFNVLKKIFNKSNISFKIYDWNVLTFSSIATKCDFALIPIPDNPFMQQKPENKLLLFWSMGLPVITTNTKSYARVMKEINENYICNFYDEWKQKITLLASSKVRREEYITAAKKYVDKHCSPHAIFNTWDYILFNENKN
jgi:hypothetical protein